MASLKGIKVDIADDNPYLKTQQSLEELPPQRLPRPPPPPPAPPLGPQMSYAEKLKLAKEAKAAGSAGSAAAVPAVPAAAAAAATTAVPSAPVVPQAPPPPAPPVVADSDMQAQEKTAADGAETVDAPRRLLEQEVPEGAVLGEDAARAKVSVRTKGKVLLCRVWVGVSMNGVLRFVFDVDTTVCCIVRVFVCLGFR